MGLDDSGVTKSIKKCGPHSTQRLAPGERDEAYYRSFTAMVGDFPDEATYAAELEEGIGLLPPPPCEDRRYAVEVGPGMSPYVNLIREAGYEYAAIEPSAWACDWLRKTYSVYAWQGEVERFVTEADMSDVGLVLMAHVLEHVVDAPTLLRDIGADLRPGSHMVIIVPDDEDQVNPDHLWFFTPASLRGCLDAAGMEVVRLTALRRIPRETFIYALAEKR